MRWSDVLVLGKQDCTYRTLAVCGRTVLKPFAIVAWAVFFSCPSLFAQGAHSHPVVAPAAVMPLLDGLGAVHHPVVTTHAEAQRYFDQGLTLIYAFNYNDAHRSFLRASEIDSTCAMALWGIALSRGSFINHRMSAADLPSADSVVRLALARVTAPHERALIEALAVRYAASRDLSMDEREARYSQQMELVAARYPDDLDVQTLYAESIMNLRPWKQWRRDGSPEAGTVTLVGVLERVLGRNPAHLGANHYYIHAVEGSRHPERALPSAELLRAGQFPAPAVHLTHMPAHVYLRTGAYALAVGSALSADSLAGPFLHNLEFLFATRMMMTDSAAAQRVAEQVAAVATRMLRRSSVFEAYLARPMLAMVRFARWGEIIETSSPDTTQRVHTMQWLWARGMAFAGVRRVAEATAALKEHDDLLARYRTDDPEFEQAVRKSGQLESYALSSAIALASGRKSEAMSFLSAGVTAESKLPYTEPPDWLFPFLEQRGRVRLLGSDARGAAVDFRADLVERPRSPRSLAGLAEALRMQGRADAAARVDLRSAP